MVGNEIKYYKEVEKFKASNMALLKTIQRMKDYQHNINNLLQLNVRIIDNVPFGIYIVNKKGNIKYVNKAMLKISGDSKEQLMHINVFSHPTYKKIGLSNKIKQGLKGKGFILGPVDYISYYSKVRTIRIFTGIPLHKINEEDEVFIVVEDITERKKAEQRINNSVLALKASNLAMLKNADKVKKLNIELIRNFNSSTDIIIEIDLKGNIIRVNKAFEKILGFSTKDIIGKSFKNLKFISKKSILKIAKAVVNSLLKRKVEKYEIEVITKLGKMKIGEVVSNRIEEKGKLIGLQAVIRDITERKKAEEEIKNLAKFPEENPNPILSINNKGIIYANTSAKKCVKELSFSKKVRSVVKNILKCGKASVIEVKCCDDIYQFTFIPVKEQGYVNVYGKNITERKKSEEKFKRTIKTLKASNMSLLQSMKKMKQYEKLLKKKME